VNILSLICLLDMGFSSHLAFRLHLWCKIAMINLFPTTQVGIDIYLFIEL